MEIEKEEEEEERVGCVAALSICLFLCFWFLVVFVLYCISFSLVYFVSGVFRCT